MSKNLIKIAKVNFARRTATKQQVFAIRRAKQRRKKREIYKYSSAHTTEKESERGGEGVCEREREAAANLLCYFCSAEQRAGEQNFSFRLCAHCVRFQMNLIQCPFTHSLAMNKAHVVPACIVQGETFRAMRLCLKSWKRPARPRHLQPAPTPRQAGNVCKLLAPKKWPKAKLFDT